MQVKRLFACADRYFLRRSLPHGIVSWRYLLPHPPPKVRIHRQLWFRGRHPRIPLPLFLLIELLLWLRWVAFGCWRCSWRIVQLRCAEIAEREAIGTTILLLRVLAMGLCHCIPPGEIFAFGLYRRTSNQEVWDYIFRNEAPAFHCWRSAKLGEYSAPLSLVQDKAGLADLLAGHGIPMAPILAVIQCGTLFDPETWLQACPRLFCKPRHGSASRDAFVIERRDDAETVAVFAVKNGMKDQPSCMDALNSAMKTDDFLVQPVLENHPLLAPMAPKEDAITLRIITEQHPVHGTRCCCATLEIPHQEDDGGRCHTILPIDPSSGKVMPFPDQRLPDPAKARHDAMFARLGECTVPFWDEIERSAMAAHEQLPELYAIAWDYVITTTGPRMLEGNHGWGTTTPQVILGGLLQDDIREN